VAERLFGVHAKGGWYTVEFAIYDGKQSTRNSSIKHRSYKIRNVSIVPTITLALVSVGGIVMSSF